MTCPRCHSTVVSDGRCNACRIAYDDPQAFEPHTRQHTQVGKRWEHWRSVDRAANERKRIEAFLGN